ncbi:hypothetical protein [Streptomyces sp. NPDC058613]|uniref:hypothetical protein n=1 Tax=Streptomyces sp. NPDC058613 TaxID=3346556 RepID=UPI003646C6D5
MEELPEALSELAELWCRGGDLPWDRLPGFGERHTGDTGRTGHGTRVGRGDCTARDRLRAASGAQARPQRVLAPGSHPLVAVFADRLRRLVGELTKITPEEVGTARLPSSGWTLS